MFINFINFFKFIFVKEKKVTNNSTIFEVLSMKNNNYKCDGCGERKENLSDINSSFGNFTLTKLCKDCYEDRSYNSISPDEFIVVFSKIEFNALLKSEKSTPLFNLNLLKKTSCFHFNCYDVFINDINKRNEFFNFMIKTKMIEKVSKNDIDNYISKVEKAKVLENEYAIGLEFKNKTERSNVFYKINAEYYCFNYLKKLI
jgi:hypothetical protein